MTGFRLDELSIVQRFDSPSHTDRLTMHGEFPVSVRDAK
jgi:hypothetical protein